MAAAITDANGDPAASSALEHRKLVFVSDHTIVYILPSKKKRYVLAEFIDSEREYVRRLKMAYHVCYDSRGSFGLTEPLFLQ